MEDFWEMVIQQHCPIIVMLTRLVDNNRVNFLVLLVYMSLFLDDWILI